MTDLQYLCASKNGKKIYYDSVNSHTATHFEDNPQLKHIVSDHLTGLDLEMDIIAQDIEMDKIIGNSSVVSIDRNDDVLYAVRKNREDQGLVPFVKNRASEPSSNLSLYLVRQPDATYELLSAWIGEFESPPFPDMDNATPESIPYWSSHAFVWGSQQIVEGTVTLTNNWREKI